MELPADHEVTFDRLRVVDEVLADPGAPPWVEGDSAGEAIGSRRCFGHVHEEHEPAVRAWLEQAAGGPA